MPAITLDQLAQFAQHKPEVVVDFPIITMGKQTTGNYVSNRTATVTGFWKNHLPYRIKYQIRADKLGGVQVSLGIVPFFQLYDFSGNTGELTTRVHLKGDLAEQKEAVFDAVTYLLRIAAHDSRLTREPPKDLDFDELVAWTSVNSSINNEEYVKKQFTTWGLQP